MKLNTNRTLESYQDSIDLMNAKGFYPIACAQMIMEDTFVFNTKQEANRAYAEFELLDRTIQAWWYEKEEFLKAVEEYESVHEYNVQIFWL